MQFSRTGVSWQLIHFSNGFFFSRCRKAFALPGNVLMENEALRPRIVQMATNQTLLQVIKNKTFCNAGERQSDLCFKVKPSTGW